MAETPKGSSKKARVLAKTVIAGEECNVNDVVNVPAEDVEALANSGVIDTNSAAVAYAESIAPEKKAAPAKE